MGNESCDLDSAVSAITLAFFYHKYGIDDIKLSNNTRLSILPMLNIPRQQLPLKTEVTYFLKECNVDLENIICKDEMPNEILESSDVILVDHHVSPFSRQVVKAIDHRPFDEHAKLPTNCIVHIEEVGSCATLISDIIFQAGSDHSLATILKMLYAVIILDTVNFSVEADRAKPSDVRVVEQIEHELSLNKAERAIIFNRLVAARADVSTLDSQQILSKDLKIIMNDNTKIAIPGFPLLVKEYIELPDAKTNLIKFARENKCAVVLLMGLQVIDGNILRDLAVINCDHLNLCTAITTALVNDSTLQLMPINDIDFLNGTFFSQKNVKASRKQILPIVKNILNNLI